MLSKLEELLKKSEIAQSELQNQKAIINEIFNESIRNVPEEHKDLFEKGKGIIEGVFSLSSKGKITEAKQEIKKFTDECKNYQKKI